MGRSTTTSRRTSARSQKNSITDEYLDPAFIPIQDDNDVFVDVDFMSEDEKVFVEDSDDNYSDAPKSSQPRRR
ncbi:hypothetical protein HK096_007311, partial [Nowakowskiella sp. JEL0078]